jgi:hypothetical protein
MRIAIGISRANASFEMKSKGACNASNSLNFTLRLLLLTWKQRKGRHLWRFFLLNAFFAPQISVKRMNMDVL